MDTLKDDRDWGRKANFGGVARNMCPFMERVYPERYKAWTEGWDEGQAQQSAPSTLHTRTG